MRLSLIFALIVSLGPSVVSQTYQVVVFSPSTGFNETRGTGVAGSQRVGAARVTGMPQPEDTHAILWVGDNQTSIDLNPAGFDFSWATDTDGITQVGRAYRPNVASAITNVAALWNGTAGSFVPLCAFPYCGNSTAYAVAGDQQVGFTDSSTMCTPKCTPFPVLHAALWRGSPATYVNLHPTGVGCERSFAFDTDGVQQVGYGTFPGSTHDTRALLWFGSSAGFVDLSPPGFHITTANAVRNGVQVGFGQNYVQGGITPTTALVWRGSASSVTALGPGVIEDTNGFTHVGTRGEGFTNHAFRWDGETCMGFDLHSLLPAGVYGNSGAEAIDSEGNIIGWAQRTAGYLDAVLWRITSSTPTPTTNVCTQNSEPNVTLMAPAPNSSYRKRSWIEFGAEATDPDGSIASVVFLANGELVGTGSLTQPASYMMTWRPSRAGTYQIQARAIDDRGAVSYSQSSTIFVR